MAQVRMHSPPARTVFKPNQRWDRQRPIVRGGVSDHEPPGPPPAPTITGVSPSSTTVAGPRTFTVTGTNFDPNITIHYTAGADAPTTATGNFVSSTSFTFNLPSGAVDTAGTITWSADIGLAPNMVNVPGPAITVA